MGLDSIDRDFRRYNVLSYCYVMNVEIRFFNRFLDPRCSLSFSLITSTLFLDLMDLGGFYRTHMKELQISVGNSKSIYMQGCVLASSTGHMLLTVLKSCVSLTHIPTRTNKTPHHRACPGTESRTGGSFQTIPPGTHGLRTVVKPWLSVMSYPPWPHPQRRSRCPSPSPRPPP